MQNQIQVFENSEFGKIEALMISGKPHFPATECARMLGYSNTKDAIIRHCKGVVKHDLLTSGGKQTINFIPEGDLYRLIIRSKLPEAAKFESWICDIVIPTIRQTGGYVGNDELFISTYLPFADENTKSLFSATLLTIRQLNGQIEAMKPKAEFFDAIADCSDAIDIGSAAKVLNMGIGRNRLFELLRNESVLMSNNQPYQSYIDRGYFRTVEQKYSKPDGSTHIYIKTLVYQKGLDYIRKIVAMQVPEYEKESA